MRIATRPCIWMFSAVGLTLLLTAAADATPPPGTLALWDNYLSVDGYDRASYFSSERDATVYESWIVDDASFEGRVTIEMLTWFGIRKPGYAYAADVIILDSDFETLHEFSNLDYTGNAVVEDTPLFGHEPYEGEVTLPDVNLEPGHYYFGVRLADPDGGGRNMMLTTGDGMLAGSTMGALWSPWLGVDDWTFIADFRGNDASDFAYRVHGRDRVIGDLNCDGIIDYFDINAFVAALDGKDTYLAMHVDCNWYNCDINDDGTVNYFDINPWLQMLGQTP